MAASGATGLPASFQRAVLPVGLQAAVEGLDGPLRLLGQDAGDLHGQRAVAIDEDQRARPRSGRPGWPSTSAISTLREPGMW